MLPNRTLLILGAGASRPYLFPTAKELTNLILERNENPDLLQNMGFNTNSFRIGSSLKPEHPLNLFLQYRNWLRESLKSCGVDEEDMELFQKRFRLSGSYSIDAFVADNPSYKPLASLMIATILLRCERKEPLEGDWYQLLFNELIDEHGKNFPIDTLSVITFNYDRSLEMYLFQSFTNRYALSDVQAWALVERVEIVHVYGSLGPLYDSSGLHHIKYGANAPDVATKNLKLVAPRVESEHLTAIRALIERSPRIIFLGFGFDRLNLQQIQIYPFHKRVFSSCCGLSSSAMARAEPGLQQFLANSSTLPVAPNGWMTWGDRSHTAAEFLHNSYALVAD